MEKIINKSIMAPIMNLGGIMGSEVRTDADYEITFDGTLEPSEFTYPMDSPRFNRAGTVYYPDEYGVIRSRPANTPRFPFAGGKRAPLDEPGATNLETYSRDLTQANWVDTDVTVAMDQTGRDGLTSGASSLTASGANGTVLDTFAAADTDYVFSVDVKRLTGTGNIDLTDDNGGNWETISVTSDWKRFEITRSQANPVIGFRIATNGDAIAVDNAQLETGKNATERIPTSGATASRVTESGMPYYKSTIVEDYQTGNDTNSGTHSVTNNVITVTAMDRDTDDYLSLDYGASFFGDVYHEVDVNVTALTDDAASALFFHALTDADDDLKDIDDASGDYIAVYVVRSDATNYNIAIQNVDGGTATSSIGTVDIAVGTGVFPSIYRSGTVYTVEVYSTAARRTQGGSGDVDTITHTVVNTAFQYVQAVASRNLGSSAKDISATISNLNIGTMGGVAALPVGPGERVECFDDYEEEDGAGKVAIDGTKITLAAGDRDEDYYVARDMGAGAIGDFSHTVDVNVTALTDDSASLFYVWTVSNSNDDLQDIEDLSGSLIAVRAQRDDATNYHISILNIDAGATTVSSGTSQIAVGTKVYLAVARTSTAGTVEVYSTAALRSAGGSGDIETISLTVVNTTFRYVYALASKNNGTAGVDISGTVENLRIGTRNELFEEKLGQSEYTSDFSAGTDSWSATNGAVAGNIDAIGGENDWLRFTVNGVNGLHFIARTTPTLTVSDPVYYVSFKYYIPAGQSNIDGLRLFDGAGISYAANQTTTDAATTVTYRLQATSASGFRIYATDGGSLTFQDAGGDDVFYIKEFTVKEVTNAWDSKAPHGTLAVNIRPSFGEADVSTDGGFVSVQDAVASLLYHDVSGNGIAAHDGTSEATYGLVFTKDTWYVFVVQWGELNSNVSQFRVGADDGAGGDITFGSWVDFDGSFTTGGNGLQIAQALQGAFHTANLRLWSRIVDSTDIRRVY